MSAEDGAGTVFSGSGTVSTSNCDPCLDKMPGELLNCAIAFTPLGCPWGVYQGCFGSNANLRACIWAILGCTGKIAPIFTVLDCYCGFSCAPKPAGSLIAGYCSLTGANAALFEEALARAPVAAPLGGDYAALLAAVDDIYATAAPYVYFFGSKEWFRGASPELREAVLAALFAATDPASPGGG